MKKRLLDIVFSTVFFVFAGLIMLIVFCVIKIVSPGPAIYKANRIGKKGKEFVLYKFRSMNVDSGKVRITTLENDDRIFPFGKFIRMTKLDETPQLLNILKSDMSVVGFRPEDKINADQLFVGDYSEILTSKPGLTSPASLFDYTHGEIYETEEDYIKFFLPMKLEMELYYVEHQSFWYDIRIIFRTALIILQKVFGKKKFNYPPEYYQVLLRLEEKNKMQREKQTSTHK